MAVLVLLSLLSGAAVGLEDGTGGSDRLSGIYKWFNLRPPTLNLRGTTGLSLLTIQRSTSPRLTPLISISGDLAYRLSGIGPPVDPSSSRIWACGPLYREEG